MRVIVCHEKHGERYYDASTTETLAASALQILTDRWEEGYWYNDPREYYTEEKMRTYTPEEIEALPSNELKVRAEQQNRRAKDNQRQFDRDLAFYEQVQRVVEQQDLSTRTVGRGRYEREVPIAWDLLQERSDYEYERVELVDVQVPKVGERDSKLV